MLTRHPRARLLRFALLLIPMLIAATSRPAPQISPADDRGTAAQVEMFVMASYLNTVQKDTGYFVPLEALNDGPKATTPVYDYINNGGGCPVIVPETGRFASTLINITRTWKGPYQTFGAGRTQISKDPYDQGTPLDPWGRAYLLFTPLGLARGDANLVTPEVYGDAFDRYTLVSVGPDGFLDEVVGQGDDLYYAFGPTVTTLGISSVSGPKVASRGINFFGAEGALITIRGIAMGDARGDARVFFNDKELTDIRGWAPRSATIQLPTGLRGAGKLKIIRGGVTSNTINLTLSALPKTRAKNWQSYK